jgi:hypothetical protein
MTGIEPVARSWWSTLPGLLTALAGLVTAIGGFLVILAQLGIWTGKAAQVVGGSATPQAMTSSAAGQGAGVPPAAAGAGLTTAADAATAAARPALEGRPYRALVVTTEDRSQVTLGPGAEIQGRSLPLESGLSIDLEKLASIDIHQPWDGTARVTLVNGQVMDARVRNTTLSGSNELGAYVSLLRTLRRIEFVR